MYFMNYVPNLYFVHMLFNTFASVEAGAQNGGGPLPGPGPALGPGPLRFWNMK